VEELLSEGLGDRLQAPLPVEVSLGGSRGMRVVVTVPDDELAAEVQSLLSGQLFETATAVEPATAAPARA
jgi:hypothetical protein